jgi:hypothetical protein
MNEQSLFFITTIALFSAYWQRVAYKKFRYAITSCSLNFLFCIHIW